LVNLSNISKTFHKPDDVTVFRNFDLEIKEGDFTILVGSNGSGKSTLLNLVAGNEMCDEGNIILDNQDISRLKDFERSKWISRIFQNPLAGTAPELSILENFRLASIRTKGKNFRIGTGEYFRKVVSEKVAQLNLGLENKLDQKVGSLSGGQRQSLALLMGIADNTKLLLLDEPAAALDPKTSQLVMQLADRMIRENRLTALLVTHQLKDVIQFGDRIIQLKEGKIIRDIRKEENSKLTLAEIYNWFE
jgi:putative ABC transport system ATP-binding protein